MKSNILIFLQCSQIETKMAVAYIDLGIYIQHQRNITVSVGYVVHYTEAFFKQHLLIVLELKIK